MNSQAAVPPQAAGSPADSAAATFASRWLPVRTVIQAGWWNLRRARADLALVFIVPIVFYSLFAFIFGDQGRSTTPRITVAVADLDDSTASKRFLKGLRKETSFRWYSPAKAAAGTAAKTDSTSSSTAAEKFTRDQLLQWVREGKVEVGVVIPAGFGEKFGSFFGGEAAEPVELLIDPADKIAPQMVSGLMQKAAFDAVDLIAENGLKTFEKQLGFFTPEQRKTVDGWLPLLRQQAADREAADAAADAAAKAAAAKPDAAKPDAESGTTESGTTESGTTGSNAAGFAGLVTVKETNALAGVGRKKSPSMSSYYAAGIAVMFLLFTATAASGSLLEEEESGTLDRLLCTRLSIRGLILGKWLYLVLMGVAQICVMFLWGQLMFGVDLFGHLTGFFIMTLCTSSAAASFGLMLATACRTRGQLAAVSNIVILSMSALGGSMIPRVFMSELLQKIGLFTFNAWALDGYIKIFWRELHWTTIWPQVSVLLVATGVFLAIAMRLGRRWETV